MRFIFLFGFTCFTLASSFLAFSTANDTPKIYDEELLSIETPVEIVAFKVTISIMLAGNGFFDASADVKGQLIAGWLTADELEIFAGDNARENIIHAWSRNLRYNHLLLSISQSTEMLNSILPHLF